MSKDNLSIEYFSKRIDTFYDLITRRNFQQMHWTSGNYYFEVQAVGEDYGEFKYTRKEYANNAAGKTIEQSDFFLEEWTTYAAICACTIPEGGELEAEFYSITSHQSSHTTIKL